MKGQANVCTVCAVGGGKGASKLDLWSGTMEEQEKMWLAALGRELSKDRIEWRRKSCRGCKVDVISIANAVAA